MEDMQSIAFLRQRSVEVVCVLVIPDKARILVFLSHDAIADGKKFNICAHQAMECIFGSANNRFAANIERRIDQNRTAGEITKPADQLVVARMPPPGAQPSSSRTAPPC